MKFYNFSAFYCIYHQVIISPQNLQMMKKVRHNFESKFYELSKGGVKHFKIFIGHQNSYTCLKVVFKQKSKKSVKNGEP